MKKYTPKTMLCSGALLAAIAFGILWSRAYADDVPQPVLKITQTATNEFQIQITNGVTFANYELYRRPVLENPVFPFTLHIIGTQGQSNFTVTAGVDTTGFFIAAIGSDWDGDGIQNYQDAQPSSAGAGVLTISIVDPANGAVVTE
jgi:hypothetical protein